jgi:aspartyl-tRNA(Asn)/glutamyl-tRNA(Gln) amidotransferase subunit C
MSLNRRDIDNIAQLARLALTEQEVPGYLASLSSIIGLIGELDRVDTSQIEPMAHPLPGQRQRLRADAVTETDHHEIYQSNAPQVEAALYLVPRVIE